METEKRPPLVIYHANCYDGFTAAWIARQAMPNCELLPATHGDEPPPDTSGRDVYILDFSYPRHLMQAINNVANSLLVLDHHKTAQEDCEFLSFCLFDMERSGAGMAWDHFFPGTSRPAWVERVEDRDLWRFSYHDTKFVHAYIASRPMTLYNWDAINDEELHTLCLWGEAIADYIDVYCEKAAQEAREVTILATDIPSRVVCVNVPYQNASEMADRLLQNHPHARYSMSYFQRKDGRWQYSLRSRSDFDVSEVAKEYGGGGGHAQAAGFETSTLLAELL